MIVDIQGQAVGCRSYYVRRAVYTMCMYTRTSIHRPTYFKVLLQAASYLYYVHLYLPCTGPCHVLAVILRIIAVS